MCPRTNYDADLTRKSWTWPGLSVRDMFIPPIHGVKGDLPHAWVWSELYFEERKSQKVYRTWGLESEGPGSKPSSDNHCQSKLPRQVSVSSWQGCCEPGMKYRFNKQELHIVVMTAEAPELHSLPLPFISCSSGNSKSSSLNCLICKMGLMIMMMVIPTLFKVHTCASMCSRLALGGASSHHIRDKLINTHKSW